MSLDLVVFLSSNSLPSCRPSDASCIVRTPGITALELILTHPLYFIQSAQNGQGLSGLRRFDTGFPWSTSASPRHPPLCSKCGVRQQHSSMSAPSTCTAGHVREYFLNGTLPAEGVVCPVDGPIFSAQKSSTLEARQVEGEGQILQVLERLRQTFRVASPF